MTITYQLEPWARYYSDPDRERLWQEHYDEFLPFHHGNLPFGPNTAMYEELEARGELQVLVARSVGQMIGYCLVAIRQHPHYLVRCGFEDSYYLDRRFRKGLTGVRLIRHSIAALERRGVRVYYFMTKEFNSIRTIFSRLGLRKCDEVWVGGLGGH